MTRLGNRTLAAVAMTILAAASAAGQGCSHPIVGRLTGQDGKPVMAGYVAITGQMKAAYVDSTGRYRLCDVPPGRHSMTATAFGMQSVVIDHVMPSSRTDTLDFHMMRPSGCWLPPRLSAAQLDSASERWRISDVHSYDITITESDGPGPGTWRVLVRGDSVASVNEVVSPGRTPRPADPKHFALLLPPQLFARLHMRLTDSNHTTLATYDSAAGYPTGISEEMNCINDAGGTIRLAGFRPVRP